MSTKAQARIAGVLYLLVGVFGGFAEGFVEPKMYVAGNAAATAGNLAANAGLVRIGVLADLLDPTLFVFLALTLYGLLNRIDRAMARAMVVLVAISAGLQVMATVVEFEGSRVATDSTYATALGAGGARAMVMLLLDTQHYGLLGAQIFFGLWLAPLGCLAYKSGWFPRALGAALVLGAACYILDVLALFGVPELGQKIAGFIVVPSAIAEVWMLGYLLLVGVRTPKPGQLSAIAA